jgi:hypothetical protein
MSWMDVHHTVVIPTYDESIQVLRTTMQALTKTDFPKDRIHVVVGFEERAGEAARLRAQTLTEEFSGHFGTFLTSFHPDGLAGEKRVKSANATWAIRQLEEELTEKGITVPQVLVSNVDSDTVLPPHYFSQLTHVFLTQPDRYRVSYQPIPVYNNNLWDAPSFSRVVAMGSTFWQMIESTRPERLVTFSSHSMTLKALKEKGYWKKDIISEDSRIFWQGLLHYNGDYRTQPLYTTVSMDAALADNWWDTLKHQYKQKRRWAWGIENLPYLAEGLLYPVAWYGSLKINEVLGVKSSPYSIEEYCHAPLFSIKKDDAIIILGGTKSKKGMALGNEIIKKLEKSNFSVFLLDLSQSSAVGTLLQAIFSVQLLALRKAKKMGMTECFFVQNQDLLNISSACIY